MPETSRVHYWIERFKADSPKLKEGQRTALHRAYIENFCGLTEQELVVFSDPDASFTIDDVEKSMLFVSAERKVKDYFARANPEPDSDEYALEQQRAVAYQRAIATILSNLYSPEQLDEIASYIVDPWDWGTVRVLLTGPDNWLGRRIRNAYLPEITDYYSVGPDGVTDITDQLFDGPDDASTQIDNLMGH